MKVEVDVASRWLADRLGEAGLVAEAQETFRAELQQGLREHYRGHWYEDEPHRGQGYRSLVCSAADGSVDAVLRRAAEASGVGVGVLLRACGEGVTLWVDPGDVEVRFAGTKQMKHLYRNLGLRPTKEVVRTRRRTNSGERHRSAAAGGQHAKLRGEGQAREARRLGRYYAQYPAGHLGSTLSAPSAAAPPGGYYFVPPQCGPTVGRFQTSAHVAVV
mmetsp:Transcript_6676/g.18857  ORF Transcript_6676/g.18857 Transcript_6676/m.18857 type:complete len:217 (+) Transcript_6676:186-836(+)|eukprot:CAMPEP_0119140438 /NCGR_PEP_ID=MMETSP1310-20130426/29209_1 /TAXON_ID=464262 /ORGANISM="Genus nov. species nov., Strain RCC2339" /LENGTH=216 /DNA_ID=CAMNT_0007131793 /DNA_START=167 /DNA_END=817 /DNA_ORIENTATION=+